MPYMYSEIKNKLSKTRESPLESMGQIISSRCPIPHQKTFLTLASNFSIDFNVYIFVLVL